MPQSEHGYLASCFVSGVFSSPEARQLFGFLPEHNEPTCSKAARVQFPHAMVCHPEKQKLNRRDYSRMSSGNSQLEHRSRPDYAQHPEILPGFAIEAFENDLVIYKG